MANRHPPNQPPRREFPVPIAPAPLHRDTRSSRQGSESDGITTRDVGKLRTRNKVTPVACRPCQQRKGKCDGGRPSCGACQAKGRTDCQYDTDGDQRRTTALKRQIENLRAEAEQLRAEKDDLKDIITAICTADDRNSLISIVQALPRGNFQITAEVAQVCREATMRATSAHTTFGPGPGRRNTFRERESDYSSGTGFFQSDRPYVDGGNQPPMGNSDWPSGIVDGNEEMQDGVDGVNGTDGTDGHDFDEFPRARRGYPNNPSWPYGNP